MKKIGIFYGPDHGSTQAVAQKIAVLLGSKKVELHSIQLADPTDLLYHDKLILGIATVGRDSWETDHGLRGWDVFLPKMSPELDFKGKEIAIYGLGNQVLYPTMFCDAIGMLADELKHRNAKIIGKTSAEGYEFEQSLAIDANGEFLGLALDEDTQAEQTDLRLRNWLKSIGLL